MVKGIAGADKRDRFATPPWTTESEEWQAIDRHLPADHLARRIAQAVERLDLGPLWDSYLGVGKRALPPDLLLKVVLYENAQQTTIAGAVDQGRSRKRAGPLAAVRLGAVARPLVRLSRALDALLGRLECSGAATGVDGGDDAGGTHVLGQFERGGECFATTVAQRGAVAKTAAGDRRASVRRPRRRSAGREAGLAGDNQSGTARAETTLRSRRRSPAAKARGQRPAAVVEAPARRQGARQSGRP